MRYRQRSMLFGGIKTLRPGRRKTAAAPLPPVRGNMRRAVVVASPDERFSEAVFILNDSALREEGVSAAELLRQAGEAAEGYVQTHFAGRRKSMVPSAALFLCGAAAALLILWAAGLL